MFGEGHNDSVFRALKRLPVRPGPSLLLTVLVILGLTLSGVLVGSPVSTGTSQARGAALGNTSAIDAEPIMAGKRAKHTKERRQEQRQDKDKDRKQDRTRDERLNDHKQDNTRVGTPGGPDGDRNQHRKQNQKENDSTKNRPRDPQPARELTTGRLPGAEVTASAAGGSLSVENRYIVLLADGTSNAMRATTTIATAAPGVIPTHVYQYAIEGFAAVIPDDQLATVQNDPRVKAVVPDEVVYAAAQTLPDGIDRIDADLNPTAKIDGSDERVDVDVAVIDTAGDDAHSDLNIWAWANCTGSPFDSDDNGHGTHVGGTIGALDNGIGVVGVAPGARLWNLRVLEHGAGLNSWVICGLDVVTQYATDQGDGLGDIEVANLSLGGDGSDSNCATDVADLFHKAFCRAVAAGVTVVVAAGNESDDAANHTPAAYDEVITVSALSDTDGQPGSLGPNARLGEPDDSLALFSNFGADVDIAAPGRDILSTIPGNDYDGTFSGTSMASPHVAGAAALYLATHPNATPAQVKAQLLDTRERIALPGDPDRINEGVLNVAAGRVPPPPTVTPPADDSQSTTSTKIKKCKKIKDKQKRKKCLNRIKKGATGQTASNESTVQNTNATKNGKGKKH